MLYHGKNGIVVAGVFDGHSSSGGGDRISRALVDLFRTLGKKLTSDMFRQPEKMKAFLTDISFVFDQMLLKRQGSNARRSGSTAAVVFYDEASNLLYTYNVGDSRTITFQMLPRGIVKGTWHATQDHKPSLVSEIDRIERAGGKVLSSRAGSSVPRVNGVLALSRSFGDFDLKREFNGTSTRVQGGHLGGDWVTVRPTVRGPYRPSSRAGADFYVAIASDGVWDMMTSKELSRRIRESAAAEKASGGRGMTRLCRDLVQENVERWKGKGADNVTLALLRITQQ